MMPPGSLSTTMTKEDMNETADLISGGDPEHKFFKKIKNSMQKQ